MKHNRCVICRGRKDPPCDHCGRGQQDSMSRIEIIRNIHERHTAAVVEGVLIDAMTAGAYVAVHDALTPENRGRLEGMRIDRAGSVVWRLVS